VLHEELHELDRLLPYRVPKNMWSTDRIGGKRSPTLLYAAFTFHRRSALLAKHGLNTNTKCRAQDRNVCYPQVLLCYQSSVERQCSGLNVASRKKQYGSEFFRGFHPPTNQEYKIYFNPTQANLIDTETAAPSQATCSVAMSV
jgi:hypothetical protein